MDVSSDRLAVLQVISKQGWRREVTNSPQGSKHSAFDNEENDHLSEARCANGMIYVGDSAWYYKFDEQIRKNRIYVNTLVDIDSNWGYPIGILDNGKRMAMDIIFNTSMGMGTSGYKQASDQVGWMVYEDDEIPGLWWVSSEESGASENFTTRDQAQQYADKLNKKVREGRIAAAAMSDYTVEGRTDGYYVIDNKGNSVYGPASEWYGAFQWLENKVTDGPEAIDKTAHILRNL